MKKIILFIALSSFYLCSQANNEVLNFSVTTHQFGTIKEEAGKVSYKFKYINDSDKPIVIMRVGTSCGCTVPVYSKKPILPNEKGEILVTFNPNRRPGSFSKTITINTNDGKRMLHIKGNVTPRPRTLKDEYPVEMGALRFRNDNVSFVRITQDKKQTFILQLFNDTERKVNIKFTDVPSFIKIISKSTINPQEKSDIFVEYDAKAKNDWGFVIDYVRFTVDGHSYSISVTANIVDNVPSIINAAKIKIDNKFINLGKHKKGDVITKSIKIFNTGKSNLYIRKIVVSEDENISFKIGNKLLKPNQETVLTVKITAPNTVQSVYNKIQIVTNDPTAWTSTIRFAMRVVN